MRTATLINRLRRAAALSVLLGSLQACGSSATSVTSPTNITRCGIAMQPLDGPLPAAGGNAVINVTAARECAWSATVEGAWLSLRAGSSGQGDGTVELSAAPNRDPAMRRGALVTNGQRTEITQAAGECEITLAESSASFSQAGGNGQVQVRSSSGMCSWTAGSDQDWLRLRTTSGQGNGTVAFEVPPSTAPPRSGTITVAGQKFSVTQSEGCTFAITPASMSASPAGGNAAVAVATSPACPWTAASNVDWIQVSPASGMGAGPVAVAVAATTGRSRTGTAVIAGQPFTVTQSQGCSYSVQPSAASIGASGGTLTVTLAANRECDWTATSNDSWITIQGRASGSGDGTVTLNVAATTGPSRSGSVTVGGQRVTVSQTQGCSFSISPENAAAPASASTGRVSVTTAAGCNWTATSNAPWLTISSGSSGSGNGDVNYSVAATNGPDRSGTLTVAGKTFTVNQGEGCTFTLSPSSANVDDSGGTGSFNVQTASGCDWTASSSVSWLTITAGSSGTGNGTVRYSATRNSGPPRNGTITAAGRTFTVRQGDGCSYGLSATSHTATAAGGPGSVNVTAGAGCGWTATSDSSWLTTTSGGSGTGNGTINFAVAANSGPSRTGRLTVEGQQFTVTQAEGCTFSIAPENATVGAAAGSTSVAVTATAGCTWTAVPNMPWITVASGASGTGNGTVQLNFEANSGGNRSGTATIAGRTFTINQSSGCSFAINPTAQTVPAGGAAVNVTVSTEGSCAWTASSNAPWLVVASGSSGSGNGTVRVDAQPNTSGPRSGTVTIAGQTLTVSQEGGCSFVVAPETLGAPAGGGNGRVDITTAASCAWNATSMAGWITITSPASGTGNGSVDFSMAANTGPARSGTLQVAGRTVTVNQDSGCTMVLTPTSETIIAGGGAGTFAVSTSAGCTWTAASTAPWITVTNGSPGTGNGTVQYTVTANATGAPRSGTISVGNAVFTVNQQ